VKAVALDVPVILTQIQSGKLRPLGAASDTRNPMLPDVPTFAEQGYPNTQSDNWYALLAPAKTPKAIIDKLNKAVHDAIADPAVKDKLIKSGAIPAPNTPAEMQAMLKAEYDRWGKIVKEKHLEEQ
jgi:tripartite-type tricarboxylate transporter receptor subunit TctC